MSDGKLNIKVFYEKIMIKTYLKKMPWLYNINARLKSHTTQKQYLKMLAYYASREQIESFDELFKKRLGDRLDKLRQLNRPPNIFFLGTDEMQDRSGTIQVLEKMGNLTYFTQADGSYGQKYPGPLKERAKANGIRLWEMVQELNAEGNPPDILISQSMGSLIDGAVLSKIRNDYGTVIINIAMDDRHQYRGAKINGSWSGTSALIPHIDLALTAAPECVDWYLKEGCPALFFPEASAPDIFYPMPEMPKIYDVCFVGGCYGIRKKIVKAVEASGVKVAAYGNGWQKGRIAIEEVPKLFAQSRIILGIGTIGHCMDFYSLKMRDFDAPMSGSLYLTHHNPDLANLFVVGKEMETYSTSKECVEKVVYYLSHPNEAEAIARAGCLRAEKEHAWGKRFGGLFEYLGMSI